MFTAGRSLTAVAITFGLALGGCSTGPQAPGGASAVSAPAPTVPYHPPTQLGGGPDDLPKSGTHFGDLFAPDPARPTTIESTSITRPVTPPISRPRPAILQCYGGSGAVAERAPVVRA